MMKSSNSSKIVSFVMGIIAGGTAIYCIQRKKIKENRKKVYKFKYYYEVWDAWLALRNKKKSLYSYFEKREYQTIAIYGLGEMGKRLCEELKDTSISVKYAIDKRANDIYYSFDIVDPEAELEKVDVIVVTAVFDFDNIYEVLSQKTDCPIVSLADIVNEV